MGRIETSSGLRLGGGGLGDVVAAVDLDKKSLTSAVFAYTIPDDTVAPNSSANNDVIRTGTGSRKPFGSLDEFLCHSLVRVDFWRRRI